VITPDSQRRRFVVATLCLALLALTLRLTAFAFGPWQDPGRALRPDSKRYVLLAHNLLEFKTLGKTDEDGLMHQAVARLRAGNGTEPRRDANGLMPEAFRTPGYPVFLAATFSVYNDIRAVILLQCLSGGVATVLVVYVACGLGLKRRSALVAGFLWAVHPALVMFDNLILTESLFNFGALVALALACRTSRTGGSLLSGLVVGLNALVRPLGLVYLPAVLAAGWGRQPRRWLAAACLVIVAVVPSVLWAGRNRSMGEGFHVSTVGDLNLLFYSAAYTAAESRHEDWFDTWPNLVKEQEAELAQRLQPGEDVVNAARRLALSEMAARPGIAAKVHAKSQVKLLVDHSGRDFALLLDQPYKETGLFSRLVLGGDQQKEGASTLQLAAVGAWTLLNAVVALAAAVGLVVTLFRRDWRLFFVCLPTIFLFMAATGAVGLERFRLPMMVPLFLSAASLCGMRPK
jgi:4-amino-4-deoxy-L-arabinose transferase-like glycosyltransferase